MRKFTEKEIAENYSGWFKKKLESGQNQNEFLPVLIRAARLWFGIFEEWMPIKDYEEYYDVSNFGRVRSLDRKAWNGKAWHDKKGRILRVTNYNNRYMIVGIQIDGDVSKRNVHKLIADTFTENPDNAESTNHIDGIKQNNFFLNLEKVTHRDNCLHAYRTGLRIGSATGKFGKLHHMSKPIVQLTKCGTIVSEYEGIMDAHRQTGLDPSGLTKACKGKYKTLGGNVWKYKKDYYG